MSKEENSECVESLAKKLRAFSATQRDEFDTEIRRITHANAAKGCLRSGGTIREVERSMKFLLQNRSNLILSTIRVLPFSYTETINLDLDQIADEYLPVYLGDFRDPYLKLVNLTNGQQNVVSAALELAEKDNQLVRETLKSEIDQYLLVLKNQNTSNVKGIGYLVVEAIGGLLTLFLAGMWVANPSGNYEPWIVIVMAFVGGTEWFRRHMIGT